MICNKCGAQISDESKFCIMCGSKIEKQQYPPYQPMQQTVQQPYQPITQPSAPSSPPQDTSANIFGVKSISDRHYSLEDIARQQEENKNEIGLASAPPDKPKKKKKKRTPPEAALPPIGAKDTMEAKEEHGREPSAHVSLKKETPSDKPVRPWYYDLKKNSGTEEEPIKKEVSAPGITAGSRPEETAPAAETSVQTADITMITEETSVQKDTAAIPPSEKAGERSAAEAKAENNVPKREPSAGPVFRFTITSPPVPTGLQRQTRLHLFGGNISSALETLQYEYDQRKNSGQRR